MNFLAHCFLAQPNALSLVGNLMGDFIRGADFDNLPDPVLLGVQNHKAVDKFTDSHDSIQAIRAVTSRQHRRFVGIMSDVTYDYFLCKHWQRFSQQDFDQFVDHCYAQIDSAKEIMHPAMYQAMSFMLSDDGLRINSTLEGVGQTLDRVARKIRFKNNFSNSIEEIKTNVDVYEASFLELFPDLQRHIETLAIESA